MNISFALNTNIRRISVSLKESRPIIIISSISKATLFWDILLLKYNILFSQIWAIVSGSRYLYDRMVSIVSVIVALLQYSSVNLSDFCCKWIPSEVVVKYWLKKKSSRIYLEDISIYIENLLKKDHTILNLIINLIYNLTTRQLVWKVRKPGSNT